jgi:hypothetical protein
MSLCFFALTGGQETIPEKPVASDASRMLLLHALVDVPARRDRAEWLPIR